MRSIGFNVYILSERGCVFVHPAQSNGQPVFPKLIKILTSSFYKCSVFLQDFMLVLFICCVWVSVELEGKLRNILSWKFYFLYLDMEFFILNLGPHARWSLRSHVTLKYIFQGRPLNRAHVYSSEKRNNYWFYFIQVIDVKSCMHFTYLCLREQTFVV